jgi:hypothetical protein
MAFSLGAMAAGMTAAGAAEGEGTREEVRRQREALQEFKLALAKTCGLRAARFVSYIVAIMLQEKRKSKAFLRMRK